MLNAERQLARLCNLQDGNVRDVKESSAKLAAQKSVQFSRSRHALTVESSSESKETENASIGAW